MVLNEMLLNEMSVNKMLVNEMLLNETSVDEMSLLRRIDEAVSKLGLAGCPGWRRGLVGDVSTRHSGDWSYGL
jgi:hypothetical protein